VLQKFQYSIGRLASPLAKGKAKPKSTPGGANRTIELTWFGPLGQKQSPVGQTGRCAPCRSKRQAPQLENKIFNI